MRITVVGSINLDLVATAPRLPAPTRPMRPKSSGPRSA